MVTANTRFPIGGKCAVVDTPSLRCMISTAKEGVFQKQSVVFFDLSQGMQNRKAVAKFLYNNFFSSQTRLQLHDAITGYLDAAGMDGLSLDAALRSLFEKFKAENIGFGAMFENL
jgi:hypothetical protein